MATTIRRRAILAMLRAAALATPVLSQRRW